MGRGMRWGRGMIGAGHAVEGGTADGVPAGATNSSCAWLGMCGGGAIRCKCRQALLLFQAAAACWRVQGAGSRNLQPQLAAATCSRYLQMKQEGAATWNRPSISSIWTRIPSHSLICGSVKRLTQQSKANRPSRWRQRCNLTQRHAASQQHLFHVYAMPTCAVAHAAAAAHAATLRQLHQRCQTQRSAAHLRVQRRQAVALCNVVLLASGGKAAHRVSAAAQGAQRRETAPGRSRLLAACTGAARHPHRPASPLHLDAGHLRLAQLGLILPAVLARVHACERRQHPQAGVCER